MPLEILALNCTLKPSPQPSSTERLLRELLAAFEQHDARGEIVRAADFNIKPGVRSDEGDGDDWPALRTRVLAADILIVGSPIWLGQPSSIAKRVLERMDAFLGERDEKQRMPSYGKVGMAAIVGNEDGAHHVSAEIFQALSEVGFTIPSGGATYWVGEAMGSVNYIDLPSTPKALTQWTPMLASNAAHLAALLKHSNYPGRKAGD
ncbi:MAG TPA: NAD(P)H-dependent oxidoreductase [Pseudolabrys sp.]|nr:NAD(P)H-dependent oxidoreductase [Pseudolabrys sp.]